MANLSKSQLNQFLKNHKRKDNEEYTHTALPNLPESFAGSYCIPKEDYDTFLNLYYESVFKYKNNAFLTEKHLDYSPILIDLDFRFPLSKKERVYNTQFIESFLKIYMKHVEKITECENVEIFVMEKKTTKPDEEKKIVKDGIHIMIPDIVTVPRMQYVLRYRVINDPATKALMETIKPTNSLDDIIDLCVIERNNWQMYGSMKSNNEPYLVTHIYNYNTDDDLDELDIKGNYKKKEILNKLSLRNIKQDQISEIHEEAYESIDKDYETMGKDYKMIRSKNKQKSRKKTKTKSKVKNNLNGEFTPEQEQKELNKIKTLVDILNPSRAESYNMWIQLGWCLHNIDYRLLDAWVSFSKKSPKYQDGECEDEWEHMDTSGLGLGTLYMWCKHDNLSKYKEITSHDLNMLIYRSLNGSHNDISRVMYEMFKDEFIYGVSKNWYQYKSHRWHRIRDGVPLKQKISNQLLNEYLRYSNKLSNKIQTLSDDDPIKQIELSKFEMTQKVVGKLKQNSFKKSLMDECIEMFYNEEIEQKLDTNMYLIGFENGVYDLNNDLFREGIPDDFLSFSTGINYEEFNEEDEVVKQVKLFLSQIIPVDATREYVLTLMSSFLDGKISEEKFPIWTGSGGNGKSKFIELFCKAFGDYTSVLPTSLITQKRGRSEQCNPILVQTKGKRFCYFQEPDTGDKINVGLMKELTGGDKIKARGLYVDAIEFKPQFKLVLACNDLPDMGNGNDDGVWRRVRVVRFTSKFRDGPDPKDPNQFPIDHNLSEKFDYWMEPFMYILLQYYKHYKKEGLYEPPAVRLETQNYQNDSDCFSQFFNECIEEKPGDYIHLDIAFKAFIDWFNISFGNNSKHPSKKDLKTNMIKKFGQSDRNGIRFKGLGFIPIENKNDNSFLNDGDEDTEVEDTEVEEEAEVSDTEHGLDN